MDTEKVISDLNKRFAKPLPPYYKRRIVFWMDEEREFADQLQDFELQNAKLVQLTGSNLFAVKKLLEHDDPYGNYVVYCPVTYEKSEDNWLLNIQLYSGEVYRTDLISQWISEMELTDTPTIRQLVKRYRKFFGSKERRAKVAAIIQKSVLQRQFCPDYRWGKWLKTQTQSGFRAIKSSLLSSSLSSLQ